MKHFNLTYLVSSDPNTGADNVNALGSQFTINLQSPLIIPKEAENCNVLVKNAVVWFVTPNIFANKNGKFRLIYNGIGYTITIPTGLYDIDTLPARINTQLNIVSNGLVPTDCIGLVPDTAQNKVVIKFNYYNTDIDFRDSIVPGNIRNILGFDDRLIIGFKNPPGTDPIPFYEEGDNFAKFNTTDYYLVKCSSLVTRGLSRNSEYLGILCRVDVTGNINAKIDYDPNQVPIIPAPEIRGVDLSELTFELVDQNNELVDTRGEYWSVIFEIHYDLPKALVQESA